MELIVASILRPCQPKAALLLSSQALIQHLKRNVLWEKDERAATGPRALAVRALEEDRQAVFSISPISTFATTTPNTHFMPLGILASGTTTSFLLASASQDFSRAAGEWSERRIGRRALPHGEHAAPSAPPVVAAEKAEVFAVNAGRGATCEKKKLRKLNRTMQKKIAKEKERVVPRWRNNNNNNKQLCSGSLTQHPLSPPHLERQSKVKCRCRCCS